MIFSGRLQFETEAPFQTVCFTQDGKYISCKAHGGEPEYRQLDGLKADLDRPSVFYPQSQPASPLEFDREPTLSYRLESDGYLLSVLSQVDDVKLTDLKLTDDLGHCSAISPDQRYLALGNNAGYLYAVDRQRNCLMILRGHHHNNNHMYQNAITYLEFNDQSNILVSVSEEETFPLFWEMSGERETITWEDKTAYRLEKTARAPIQASMVRFSPTESKVLLAGPDNAGGARQLTVFDYDLGH